MPVRGRLARTLARSRENLNRILPDNSMKEWLMFSSESSLDSLIVLSDVSPLHSVLRQELTASRNATLMVASDS